MTVAKLFINSVERDLLKACVPREACRSLDQAKFDLPSTTDVCPNDEITYVQDMANLGHNRLLFNFEFHPKDESGYAHHIIGHCTYPSALSHWCFQNVLTDDGLKANDLTVNCCGCAVFTCGKVTNTCAVAKAFCFNGGACGRYLIAPNESDYDFQNNQKFTLAAWIFPMCGGAGFDGLIVKRCNIATTLPGYSLDYCNTSSNVGFQIASATCVWSVDSVACSAPNCMWTHVVVTYDAQLNQNGMKVYINGELNATGTSCTITGSMLNNCALTLGATTSGIRDFAGRMDDVRVFADKELTLCQVASLYHDGAISYQTGKWDGLAIRFDGDTGHGIVPDAAPADPQPCCLVAQLKFECNLTDSKGCNNGTMTVGCETYVAGLVDCKAFCFDGGCCGRYITLGNEGNFDFNRTCSFSISSWIKAPAGGTREIVTKRDGGVDTAGFNFRMKSNGTLRLTLASTDAIRIRVDGSTSVEDDNWHHVVTTYDGTGLATGVQFYVDGVQESKTTVCDALGCGSLLNDVAVVIGALGSGESRFTGLMDCVRIWKTELTPNETRRLYQSTYGTHNGQYEYITWVKVAAPCVCGSRTIFHKSLNSTEGIEMEITDSLVNIGFTASGFAPSGFTSSLSAICNVTWRHGINILTSTSDVVDNTFHQIRVRRDKCNLVSLFIDNVKQACQTITCDPTSTAKLEFGRDACGGQFFCGDMASFRFYHGNLNANDICRLWSKRNPRTNVKFGGDSTKITKSISKKKLVTQSFSKQLGEIEVRATTFNCRTPEFILETLIKCNTDLDTHFHGLPAGITLQVYQADGKLQDIANDLSQLTGKIYLVDGVKQFHLHDSNFKLTTASFSHGIAMSNIDSARDDAEIVNELLIIGANKRYVTAEVFTGDCVQTVFDLQQGPVTARVEHPILSEKCPEVDYEVCSVNKTLTFTTAPDMCGGASNILIEYEYELPLNIRGTNPSSIVEFGRKAKRLVLPWIQTRQDGVRFINAYLNNFQDVKNRFEVTIPGLANGIDVHDVITITNPIKNIAGTFIIRSITWEYPKAVTRLQVGEFDFHMLEFARQITEKIHDLESAVTSSKDLRDFESPQEVLALIDTVAVNLNQAALETLALIDTGESERKFKAFYGKGKYGVDVYSTEQPE